MVKKQNNFNWWILVLAVIAIIALILAAIAFNKANMTGNAFFDFLRKKEVAPDVAVGGSAAINGGYCTGSPEICRTITGPSVCIATEGCYWIPEGTVPDGLIGKDFGVLGNFYLSNAGNFDILKGYEVKYDSEGNLVYEKFGGGDQPQGCIDSRDCKSYDWYDCNGDGIGDTKCKQTCKSYSGGKDCGPTNCCGNAAA